MKAKILIALIGGTILSGLGWSQVWAGDREDVAATTADWAAAFNENNTDSLLGLYDGEAVVWGTTSKTMRATWDDRRKYFAGPFRAVMEKKISDLRVKVGESIIRIYGDTAINTGYYTFSWTQREEAKTRPARFSFVYVKRGDRWKIVDHHSSKIP